MIRITIEEYSEQPLYSLENTVYNRVRDAFIEVLSDKVADRLLEKHWSDTLQKLSANSYVNILKNIEIL